MQTNSNRFALHGANSHEDMSTGVENVSSVTKNYRFILRSSAPLHDCAEVTGARGKQMEFKSNKTI